MNTRYLTANEILRSITFVFANLNGFGIEATNHEVVETVLALIVREIDFAELVRRFQDWLKPTETGAL